MNHNMFWWLIDQIRDRASKRDVDDAEALRGGLVNVLSEHLTADELLKFDAIASELASRADTPAMVGAMFLIEGYVSDDSFMDFRDGLILLGKDVYEAAVDDPDSLAGHALVRKASMATGADQSAEISLESINSGVCDAWVRVTGTTDEDDFWEASDAFARANLSEDMVEHQPDEAWQINDAVTTRTLLPRLYELFAHRFSPRPSTLHLPAPPPTTSGGPSTGRGQLSEFQSGFAHARAQAAWPQQAEQGRWDSTAPR